LSTVVAYLTTVVTVTPIVSPLYSKIQLVNGLEGIRGFIG